MYNPRYLIKQTRRHYFETFINLRMLAARNPQYQQQIPRSRQEHGAFDDQNGHFKLKHNRAE